jgi:hypothetical protein
VSNEHLFHSSGAPDSHIISSEWMDRGNDNDVGDGHGGVNLTSPADPLQHDTNEISEAEIRQPTRREAGNVFIRLQYQYTG